MSVERRNPEQWKAYQRDWNRVVRARKAGQTAFDNVTDYRRNGLLRKAWR